MTDYIKNILQIKDPNLHFTDVVFENNDGRDLRTPIHRRLGGPLPRLLSNGTHPHRLPEYL